MEHINNLAEVDIKTVQTDILRWLEERNDSQILTVRSVFQRNFDTIEDFANDLNYTIQIFAHTHREEKTAQELCKAFIHYLKKKHHISITIDQEFGAYLTHTQKFINRTLSIALRIQESFREEYSLILSLVRKNIIESRIETPEELPEDFEKIITDNFEEKNSPEAIADYVTGKILSTLKPQRLQH